MPRTRGTTTQRGYGAAHQAERARRMRQLKRQGVMPCAHCGKPLYPWMDIDLGHTDDRTGYTGLEHERCNRAKAARKVNAIRRAGAALRPRSNLGQSSRRW